MRRLLAADHRQVVASDEAERRLVDVVNRIPLGDVAGAEPRLHLGQVRLRKRAKRYVALESGGVMLSREAGYV
jgi:hypothetical protein